MFDDVFRELDKLSCGITSQITVSVDEAGYFDRVCPTPECGSAFKVLFVDWKEKMLNDKAYCPFCRSEAGWDEFNTPEQQTHFGDVATVVVSEHLNHAFQSSAESFNHQQPRGFITLRMSVDAPTVQLPVPPEAEEAMTLRVACEVCGCRYAVVGVGYFCPACGHNSANLTFDQSLERARNAIAELPAIKSILSDRDVAAQVAQNLIEGTFSNLVTAFQFFAATVYSRLPAVTSTPRRNAFQSLIEGSRLWHAAGGRGYATILDVAEMADLTRLFQQRHVLQHSQGMVDQHYLDRSGDTTYTIGQRIVVREGAVLRLTDLLTKLAVGMREDLG